MNKIYTILTFGLCRSSRRHDGSRQKKREYAKYSDVNKKDCEDFVPITSSTNPSSSAGHDNNSFYFICNERKEREDMQQHQYELDTTPRNKGYKTLWYVNRHNESGQPSSSTKNDANGLSPIHKNKASTSSGDESETWRVLDKEEEEKFGSFPPLREEEDDNAAAVMATSSTTTTTEQENSYFDIIRKTACIELNDKKGHVTTKRSSTNSVWTEISFDDIPFNESVGSLCCGSTRSVKPYTLRDMPGSIVSTTTTASDPYQKVKNRYS